MRAAILVITAVTTVVVARAPLPGAQSRAPSLVKDRRTNLSIAPTNCNNVLSILRRDTLRSAKGFPLVDPFHVVTNRAGLLIVADRSEKALTVFDLHGSQLRRIGGVGTDPGQFITLAGAALIGDTMAVYDYNSATVTLLSLSGRVLGQRLLPFTGAVRARTVRTINDSLMLVVEYPGGKTAAPMLSLTGTDLRVRAKFWILKDYFARTPRFFVGYSVPHADGGYGIVAGGVVGGDSLHVFDYNGRSVAAGSLRDERGRAVRSIEAIARANHDSAFTRDGKFVGAEVDAFAEVVAVGDDIVVVQLSRPPAGALFRRDINDSNTFVAVAVERTTKTVRTLGGLRMRGTLVGRPARGAGEAWIVRTTDHSAEEIELITIGISHSARTTCR